MGTGVDMISTDSMRDIITRNRAWYCLDCGKCSAVCPITRWEKRCYTTPRLLVEKAVGGRIGEFLDDPLFWSCLTCQRCSELCPSDIHFSEFLRDMRALVRDENHCGNGAFYRQCTHGEVIQTWQRLMTETELKQDRLDWLDSGLRVAEQSDTLYFAGCLPYYDVMFKKLGFEGVEIARAALKILNCLGIEPVVLPDERCCGHDLLWQGDLAGFRALAERNLAQFKASGARRIVATCPECVRTLKMDYPQYVGDHGLQVVHIAELLEKSRLPLAHQEQGPFPLPVTDQDPCRLGRHLGVYDAPRRVIANLGFELKEMERARHNSLCCGTSCWTACGQASRNIQVERLQEARSTGARLLVTTCAKCQIHFKCAQAAMAAAGEPALCEQTGIEIRDLTTLVAEQLV
jgi:heterodisulfide reductase subunit D